MIRFKYIEIEGFGGIANELVYPLDKSPLTIIRGRNGAGKTTVPSALVWAITGQTLKNKNEVATWAHKRPKDFRGTRVKVVFDKDDRVDCSITRCLEFKGKIEGSAGKNRIILEGFANAKKGKKDLQKEINEFLGYSYDLLTNSLVFGQKMKRIIEEDNTKKKKLLEEAFQISYIEKAQELTNQGLKDLNTKLLTQSNEIDKIKGDTALVNEKLYSIVTIYENKLESYKTTLKAYLSNAKKVRAEKPGIEVWDKEKVTQGILKASQAIDGFKESLELYQKYDKEEFLAKNKLDTKEYEVQVLKDKMSLLHQQASKPKKTICSSCGSKLTSSQSTEHIKKELEETRVAYNKGMKEVKELGLAHSKLKSLAGNLNLTKELIRVQEKKLSDFLKIQQEITKYENLKKNYSKNLKAAKKLIKDHKLTKPKKPNPKELEATLAVLREKLEVAENYYDTLSKERDLHLWALKDPLSNKGLKMYIFDTMLDKLNKHLIKYERLLNFKVHYLIDLESANKDLKVVLYRDNILTSYEDLSGGEAQLVNIASAFALHDTISENKPCNLLWLDEVFESLDSDNIQIVADLIEQMSQNKNIHLITHLEGFNPYHAKIIQFTTSKTGNTRVLLS